MSDQKYAIKRTARFKKGYKKIKGSGRYTAKDFEELKACIEKLAMGEKLAEKYHDHDLKGYSEIMREFHFRPDLLVRYAIVDNLLILSLEEIGNHNTMFG